MRIEDVIITKEEYQIIKQYEDTLNKINRNKSVFAVDLIMKNKLISILTKYGLAKGCTHCNSAITLYVNCLRLLKHYEQVNPADDVEEIETIEESITEEINNTDTEEESEEPEEVEESKPVKRTRKSRKS